MVSGEMFIAHISDGEIQTCNEHSINTARYASENLKCISLTETAYLAGLLHDCGKYTQVFSDYIIESSQGKGFDKQVIHSFAGVNYFLKRYHVDQDDWAGYLAAELISYAIGSHHGLFDCMDENHENGFAHRLRRQPDYDREAIENFLEFGPEAEWEIGLHFEKAKKEIESVVLNAVWSIKQDDKSAYYFFGLLARLIASSLMDADRQDTSEFMNRTDKIKRVKADSDLWRKCLYALEGRLALFSSDSAIQKARREMSDYCYSFAEEPCGIYRLNIPTGGGKTLSSLRYALRHCEKWGKRRIIYVAPLISILEQNSKVIRDAIGNGEIVLEHHSDVVHDGDGHSEEKQRYDLLAETWDSPIVVTTLVQFLDAIFAGRTSCVRRFHALCDSVIILDEIQSVPDNMLTLFNLALNFLNRVCNSTMVLCSATQPCFESLKYKLNVSERTIIPAAKYAEYHEIFRRTRFKERACSIEDVPEIIRDLLNSVGNVLLVCNTKAEAVAIFQSICGSEDFNGFGLYHLSASMCMQHRKEMLERMYEALNRHEKMICVSTQVIEAGVDISFESVVRFSAGIENIVQSAGRCNRNGESGRLMPVVIIKCSDEKLGKLTTISNRKTATAELLYDFSKSPDKYNGDLSSDKAVVYYYRKLYGILNSHSDSFDYPVKGKPSLYDLLSDNMRYCENSDQAEKYSLRQAFRSAGKEFKVLDDSTETVVVPYGNEGKEIIAALCSEKAEYDLNYLSNLIGRARKFCISIYHEQFDRLVGEGAVYSICDGKVLVLKEGWYDENMGLVVLGKEGGSRWDTLIL